MVNSTTWWSQHERRVPPLVDYTALGTRHSPAVSHSSTLENSSQSFCEQKQIGSSVKLNHNKKKFFVLVDGNSFYMRIF